MSKKTVFVVMPLSEESHDLWEIGILETVQSLGWECVRADQMVEPGFIVDQIYEHIARADVIIGEMTGRNPNVFYEIGFAHALGKPTILLAASEEDLKAFDTQGFRHFLHGGRITEVRRILRDVLLNIHLPREVEPEIPGGEIIYEWPSPSYEPPDLRWVSLSSERDSQIDKYGGQCIKILDHIGKVISVSNTDEYWNWHPEHSIMRLLERTDRFHIGDLVYLVIEGRVSGKAQLQFLGDGGWLNPNTKQEYVNSWSAVRLEIDETPTWTTWVLRAKVQPTNPHYDPAQRGTTAHLVSSVGMGTALYKKIQVIQMHKA